MKLSEAVKHYGTQSAVARELDLDVSTISKWRERGGIVPIRHAIEIANRTEDEVPLGLDDYR